MAIDNKISFIGGYILTAATTIELMGLLQAAAVGFIGGLFGLIGKEVFYFVKRKIKNGWESAKAKWWLFIEYKHQMAYSDCHCGRWSGIALYQTWEEDSWPWEWNKVTKIQSKHLCVSRHPNLRERDTGLQATQRKNTKRLRPTKER